MEADALQALEVHKGVFLLKNLVPVDKAEAYCSHLLQPTEVDFAQFETKPFRANPFFAFCQLYAIRWNDQDKPREDSVTHVVTSLSDEIHKALYDEGGIWANLPEDGCSEDHQGRPFCNCPDKTPHYPRSSKLNCVEALAYRNGSRRDWHRDANWMVGLTFGNTVKMGFQREDDDEPCIVDVESGNAVIFNGGLHKHAVLGIIEGTAPEWWKYPFSRVVFLMRDYRQSYRSFRRKVQRQEAAVAGGKKAAEIAAAKFGLKAEESDEESNDEEKEESKDEPWWVTEKISEDHH